MSHRYAEHDPIAHRLVMALDALPVPAGPTSLRAPAKPSLLHDRRMVLAAALLLALVTTLASPQLQQAASDLTRYLERTLFGPGWVGYYLDNTAVDAAGRPASRLRFGSSETLGAPLSPDIVGEFTNHGQWSPDRERLTVINDSKMYVADRSGHLRFVADVGTGFSVRRSGWLSNDRIWGLVWATSTGVAAREWEAGTPWSYVTVDLSSSAVERRILTSFPGGGQSFISPDGRLLPVLKAIGGCWAAGALYDLVTHETVDVLDGNGRPASLSPGFLNDGRIVVAYCDRTAGRIELYVGAPGSRPALIATVPTTILNPIVVSDKRNDEILVIANGLEAAQAAFVFDPAGRLIRSVNVPKLADQALINAANLSSDGKFLAVTFTESRGAPFVQFVTRTAVIDLRTGQVTYVCDGGCDWLLLR